MQILVAFQPKKRNKSFRSKNYTPSVSRTIRSTIKFTLDDIEIFANVHEVIVFSCSTNMHEAETRRLARFIARSAFIRPRSNRPTWPKNVTRTTIISISIPTSRYNRSHSTMGLRYFLSLLRTPEWICIFCR